MIASQPDAAAKASKIARLKRRFSRGGLTSPHGTSAMILSSRHRLWQRYGPDGVHSIEMALRELVSAMAGRGIEAVLVYADDSPLLGRYGVLPADTGDPASVARLVREMSSRMQLTDESLRYVLIVGDEGIVPYDRPDNPSPDDEGSLKSDHIYAADKDEPLCPVRAVGRMPDRGLDFLVASIREAAEAHRRIDRGRMPELAPEAFGYSASVWKRAARGVFAAVGDPRGLRLSPPLTHVDAPRPGPEGPRYRYYNLHGMVDSPAWFGQRDPSLPAEYDRFPVALRPEDIIPAPGSAVFSAACYGAHLDGRAVHDSIALTSLAGGTRTFVGATGVAYGGLDGSLFSADLLGYRFWEALLSGAPAGQALSHAKWSLVTETLARQGYVDAEDEKAVLNFVLYGDPTLVYHVPTSWAEDVAVADRVRGSVEWAGPAQWVGTPPVRPHAIDCVGAFNARSSAGRQLVAHVQKSVTRWLPEFGSGEVGVSTMPAPRKVHAKSGLVVDDPNGPVVITLKKSLLTLDGAHGNEVVRVTVDRRGDIKKMMVSR